MKFLSARYSRRDILKVAASTTIVSITSAFSSGCSPKIADLETIAIEMTGELNHPQKAREIGAVQLAGIPLDQHQPYEELTRELLLTLKLIPEEVTVDTLLTLNTRLSTQVRQDFADENVVIVDSWMLSGTEVKLCILAATMALI